MIEQTTHINDKIDNKIDNKINDKICDETLKKNLIKQKLIVDYKKMYSETFKSGDSEGAKLLKKMIRKLSNQINETNENYELTDDDEIGIVDEIFMENDELFLNIDDDSINIKLSNLNKYNIIDYFDYDNSKISLDDNKRNKS